MGLVLLFSFSHLILFSPFSLKKGDFMTILYLKSLIFIFFLSFFFFNKVIIKKKNLDFYFVFFFVFLSSSCAACDLCRLNTTVWFSLSCCDALWWVGDSNGKTYSIETSNQIIIVSML